MSDPKRDSALKRMVALAEIPAANVGHDVWTQYCADAELLLGRDWNRIRDDVQRWRGDVLDRLSASPQ